MPSGRCAGYSICRSAVTLHGHSIGDSLSNRLSAKSTEVAPLDMAVMHHRPPEGIILHSDRGIQHASEAFRKQLQKYRMTQSMRGKGNCYDNAVNENVFKTLKTE